MLGDLVQLVEKRMSPVFEQRPALNMFADPSGKATGRILMSRDGSELLARDYIVYVDLGADDNVKVGDRITIYRPLGKGNLFKKPETEDVTAAITGSKARFTKAASSQIKPAEKPVPTPAATK